MGVRSWAIAGRSKAKLEAMATKHGLKPTGVVVADVGDAGSLTAMCARAAILMNATGPYRFYAAVHGFGGAKETRAQRKELLAKLEAEAPGSSVGPVPLGPRTGRSWA